MGVATKSAIERLAAMVGWRGMPNFCLYGDSTNPTARRPQRKSAVVFTRSFLASLIMLLLLSVTTSPLLLLALSLYFLDGDKSRILSPGHEGRRRGYDRNKSSSITPRECWRIIPRLKTKDQLQSTAPEEVVRGGMPQHSPTAHTDQEHTSASTPYRLAVIAINRRKHSTPMEQSKGVEKGD